jgi:hypothetical protein
MRMCPCCKEYGDVWEVVFKNLDDRRGVMCFECDTVWESVSADTNRAFSDYETLMKEHGVAPDWKLITQVQRVFPTPPETSL